MRMLTRCCAFVALACLFVLHHGILLAQDVAPVKGPTVAEVTFGDEGGTQGFFVHAGDKNWNRLNPDRSVAAGYVEYGRDEWSVYLKEASGDATVHLNLWTKTVTQQAGGVATPLGKVLAAATTVTAATPSPTPVPAQAEHAAPVKGATVAEVSFGDDTGIRGLFVHAGDKKWNRLNPDRSVVSSFEEYGRDEWSVYLKDPAGGGTVHINLWTKTVKQQADTTLSTLGRVLGAANTVTPVEELGVPGCRPPQCLVGTVYIPPCPEGQQRGADRVCRPEVFFHSEASLTLGVAQTTCVKNGWVLATAEEVQAAWETLNLNVFAYGMLADGRFALPVQSDMGDQSNFKRGANIGINGGNQGFFYVLANAVPRVQKVPPPPPDTSLHIATYGNVGDASNYQQIQPWWPKGVEWGYHLPWFPPDSLWNPSIQHPSQALFGLGDAVLMRDAAARQLQREGKEATNGNVDALLGALAGDGVARYRFAPFLLDAAFEALSTPTPNEGQMAFRKFFEAYAGYIVYNNNVVTFERWRDFTGGGTFRPPPRTEYASPFGHFLPEVPPDLAKFKASLNNNLFIDIPGTRAIQMLLGPANAASLPQYSGTPIAQVGANVEALAAGVAVGGVLATTAGTLALVSSAVFGASVAVASTTAAGIVSTSVVLTPAVLIAEGSLKIVGSAATTAVSGAAISVAVAVAFAALVGKAIFERFSVDAFDMELRRALDAGPQSVDVYAMVSGPNLENRSTVFSYLLKMLIGDPADRGVLTLEVPPDICAPGEKINASTDLCVKEVKFYSEPNLTLQQAMDKAAANRWTMATEEEVVNAWTWLNLDVYAFGMMSDGRFAVPVHSDHPNFKIGHNVGAVGGNQGFFYTSN